MLHSDLLAVENAILARCERIENAFFENSEFDNHYEFIMFCSEETSKQMEKSKKPLIEALETMRSNYYKNYRGK